MDITSIQPLLNWLAEHPALAGLVVLLIAAAESLAVVGILVPGVVFMLGIGTLVGLGALPLVPTLVWASLGAIIGDGVSYWLGHHFETQLRHVWPLSKYPKLIPQGVHFFKKHGSISVFFGRFIGPVRPIIPAVAGIMGMPPVKFYTINILSAILWAPVVILPGVAVGVSFHNATSIASRFAVLSIVLMLVLWFSVWLLFKCISIVVMYIRSNPYWQYLTAKTKVPQLLVVSILLIGPLLFYSFNVSNKQSRSQFNFAGLSEQSWWNGDWQQFYADPSNNNRHQHVNLQWWGQIRDIEKILSTNSWQAATVLSYRNIAKWLVPNPRTSEVPLWHQSISGETSELLYVYHYPSANQSVILRLWSINPSHLHEQKQLWLGSLSTFQFTQLMSGVDIPKISLGVDDINSLFKFSITSKSHNLKFKRVERQGKLGMVPVYLVMDLSQE